MKTSVQKMIDRISFLGLTLMLAVALTGVGYAEPPKTLSFGSTIPYAGFNKQFVDTFASKISKLTNNQLKVQQFFGGVLGSQWSVWEMMGIGEVDMIWDMLGPSRYAKGYDPTLMNFYFPNKESVQRYWSPANPIYKKIQEVLIKNAHVRHVGVIDPGIRVMTSNKPVFGPDDIKGIKLRVPGITEFVKTWKGLGALVTPMPGSEIFGGLQTGVIDGQENTLPNIYGRSLWEVQKFLIFTDHALPQFSIFYSEANWQKLSEEHRKAIVKAADLTRKEMNDLIPNLKADYINKLRERGMVVIYPNVVAIRKAARPSVDKLLAELPPEVVDAAEWAIGGSK